MTLLANHLKSLPDKELENLLSGLDPKSLANLGTDSTVPARITKSNLKTAKKGVTDSDFIQKIYTFLMLCLEIFKAGLACFLVLLVPMTCDDKASKSLYVCTSEDLRKSNLYNFTVLWNYVTFIILMGHYLVIWYREQFMIEYLDQDSTVPKTNLVTVLPDYPSISTYFTFYNRLSTLSTLLFLSSALINIILSGMVSYHHHPSSQSTTVFLSNTILIFSILSRSITASLYASKAISIIQIEMIEFNQIDSDHLSDKGTMLATVPWMVQKVLGEKLKQE